MTQSSLKSALAAYGISGVEPERFGSGHINDTYNLPGTPYLMQKINTNVFTHPELLMRNIELVTSHIRCYAQRNALDADRATLSLRRTLDGKTYYIAQDGAYYRMMTRIDHTRSYDKAVSCDQMYDAAKVLGAFGHMLSDFDASLLHATIAHFHDTPRRVLALEEAIACNSAGRAAENSELIRFAMDRKGACGVIVNGIESGALPLRVTHNDTKLNNFLFDDRNHTCLCLIDLDTVMSGSVLYDFGDALRFGASTASEDETDLDKVQLDLDIFAAFTKGYIESAGMTLTQGEMDLLAPSVLWMTYECGVRFLTDDLNGDVYFKIHYPRHNRDRAANQFALAGDIERKLPEMQKIVGDMLKNASFI